MPNWCECDLFIEGPKDRISEFLELVKTEKSEFDFNRLIPYPEHFKKMDEIAEEWDRLPPEDSRQQRPRDGYNQGGHKWCIENWGTKWNADVFRVDEIYSLTDDSARYAIYFATAWSPPCPVIEAASRLFPDLRFDLRYYEGGMMFHGMFLCENGERSEDECGRYFGDRGG